jgi:hypothetical protein
MDAMTERDWSSALYVAACVAILLVEDDMAKGGESGHGFARTTWRRLSRWINPPPRLAAELTNEQITALHAEVRDILRSGA